MGEKFGYDNIWESYLVMEFWFMKVKIDVVLDECKMLFKDVMNFKVGDMFMLDVILESFVLFKCGEVELFYGIMGCLGFKVVVWIDDEFEKFVWIED